MSMLAWRNELVLFVLGIVEVNVPPFGKSKVPRSIGNLAFPNSIGGYTFFLKDCYVSAKWSFIPVGGLKKLLDVPVLCPFIKGL